MLDHKLDLDVKEEKETLKEKGKVNQKGSMQDHVQKVSPDRSQILNHLNGDDLIDRLALKEADQHLFAFAVVRKAI